MKNVIVTKGERVSAHVRAGASRAIGAFFFCGASVFACGGRALEVIIITDDAGAPDSAASSTPDTGATAMGTPGVDPNSPPAPTNTCSPLVNPTGANCSVSFTKDLLFARMGAAGTWGCAASGCHDPQGGTTPKIDVSNPMQTYLDLYLSGSGSAPYINPCSSSVSDSEIVCNLNLSAEMQCGSHMPMGSTTLPSADDLALVTSWVECGSPLN